jgi:membrane protease YdiL (CAAX protease family)
MINQTASRPSFVQRYSIALFSILAFVLGAGTITLIVLNELPPPLALASALSASIAGLIMTAVEDGREGLKLMLSRLLIWRVGVGYWLFAILFLVPVILLGALFNPLFNGDPLSLQEMEPAFAILPTFIMFIIVAGLGQELGWTGYLLPRLQASYRAATAAIIRAAIVAIWHLPIFILSMQYPAALEGFQYSGWIAQKGFTAAIMTGALLFMLPWSIFITWMFNNTKGSLLLVAILHGSEIWVAYWMTSTGINPGNLDNYWGYGAIMVLMASLIVIITSPQDLSRKYKRIVYQTARR